MGWSPPLTFEEKLKKLFVPPGLYMKYRTGKELRRGEKEIHLLPYLVNRSRNALDVGANKGVWSYLLSGLCQEVHAFEPNPKLFEMLARGVKGNATAQQMALSNFTGTAELRIPEGPGGYSNQGASLSTVKVAGNYKAIEVPVETLDNLDIADIGFIKIDVEGHELSVLEGARQTIARDRPVMIIELEEAHAKQPIEQLVAEIEGYGYTALALKNNVLTPVRDIDMQRHHRAARHRDDYIFNFIFLPAVRTA